MVNTKQTTPTVMLLFLDNGMREKPTPEIEGFRIMLGRTLWDYLDLIGQGRLNNDDSKYRPVKLTASSARRSVVRW